MARTEEQRLLHQQQIVKLLRRGWARSAIADELKLSVNQVRADWNAAVESLRSDMLEDTKMYIALKLAEYSEIKKEAWEAWERSKKDAEKVQVEEGVPKHLPDTDEDEDGEEDVGRWSDKKGKGKPKKKIKFKPKKGGLQPRKRTTTREGKVGNSEYLRTILVCIEAERELLGLNPATDLNVNVYNWDVLAAGIPDGPVPDDVEAELERAAKLLPPPVTKVAEVISITNNGEKQPR